MKPKNTQKFVLRDKPTPNNTTIFFFSSFRRCLVYPLKHTFLVFKYHIFPHTFSLTYFHIYFQITKHIFLNTCTKYPLRSLFLNMLLTDFLTSFFFLFSFFFIKGITFWLSVREQIQIHRPVFQRSFGNFMTFFFFSH